ncbi:MAG: helix-turn-helix domain-containing protein [Rhodospirillaceae bacterium]
MTEDQPDQRPASYGSNWSSLASDQEALAATEEDRQIGRTIHNFRKIRGLSAADLGRISGLDTELVSRLEWGMEPISASVLWTVSEALDIPYEAFFGHFHNDQSPENPPPEPSQPEDQQADPNTEETSALIREFCQQPKTVRRAMIDLLRMMDTETSQT